MILFVRERVDSLCQARLNVLACPLHLIKISLFIDVAEGCQGCFAALLAATAPPLNLIDPWYGAQHTAWPEFWSFPGARFGLFGAVQVLDVDADAHDGNLIENHWPRAQ